MNRLRSALRILRYFGIAGILRKLPGLLYSRSTMWLLERRWDPGRDEVVAEDSGVIFREASRLDLEKLVETWPPELSESYWGTEKISNMLQSRFDQGLHCFVACQGDTLLSSHWCRLCENDRSLPLQMQNPDAFESISGNTVTQARGKGIFGKLLLYTMRSMAARGKTVCYGRVKPERKAAIRALEKVGFYRRGLLTSGVILGFRFYRFDDSMVGEA